MFKGEFPTPEDRMGGISMAKNDLALRVGGAAGDGVSSTAESFAKISARSGLHTWTYSSYQSVIRGGHVWTQVRGGLEPLLSHGGDPDVVLCLNQQTMDVHQADVLEGGAIIYDVDGVKPDSTKVRKGVRLLGIPLRKKAQTLSPNALMRNTVALGAAVHLFDMDFRHVESAFKDIWGDKKPEIAEQNLKAAQLGAEAVKAMGGSLQLGLKYSNEPKYLMTGNEAISLGALAAGVKFLAQYPMTPASSILHWMAVHGPKYGVVVKQVEDELAAMNMTVGAGFAGVRAMTATSGGGFSLMVEAIGQAGMTETPLVAILVQRSGPSTGLPTKTEQGDLNLALGAGQGDWPRAILAPRNPEECFRLTAQAFNLAEIYQTPIIVMSDLYLGEGFRTVEKFDFNVPIVRGMMATDGGVGNAKEYKRYQITDSGVSPRALPGTKGFQHVAATDEHMESSELISDVLSGLPEFVEERRKMHEKRMRKLEGLRKDTPPPEMWGSKNADLTLIVWGSTWGAAHEAIREVEAQDGVKVNSLEFPTIFPFHADATQKLLRGVKQSLAVEGNYTGQFSRLLRAETGYKPDHFYGRYDGEPFASRDIADKILEVVA
ncbi:MAG: 2-oxoacid:acceptor oxidoreductase subunit alpha [Methanobacteriota archaeon]|nr:MAG: 2-oxoacid:acceptor oxidoreductase subunit alpha [Euryarchaeota archaeon]